MIPQMTLETLLNRSEIATLISIYQTYILGRSTHVQSIAVRLIVLESEGTITTNQMMNLWCQRN